jgi:protein ImuA
MSNGLKQAERLAALRAEVKKIEGLAGAGEGRFMPLGMAEVDARIAGGGLAVQALHEVAAASPDFADDAAATLFMAALAGCKSRGGGPQCGDEPRGEVLWALARRDLFAPASLWPASRPTGCSTPSAAMTRKCWR